MRHAIKTCKHNIIVTDGLEKISKLYPSPLARDKILISTNPC